MKDRSCVTAALVGLAVLGDGRPGRGEAGPAGKVALLRAGPRRRHPAAGRRRREGGRPPRLLQGRPGRAATSSTPARARQGRVLPRRSGSTASPGSAVAIGDDPRRPDRPRPRRPGPRRLERLGRGPARELARRDAPMLYARLTTAATRFEPQRNLMTHDVRARRRRHGRRRRRRATSTSPGTAGRGLARRAKRAAGSGSPALRTTARRSPPEDARLRRADRGVRLLRHPGPGRPPAGRSTSSTAPRPGSVGRDMYLLTSRDHGAPLPRRGLHPWKINACPMSSESLADSRRRRARRLGDQGAGLLRPDRPGDLEVSPPVAPPARPAAASTRPSPSTPGARPSSPGPRGPAGRRAARSPGRSSTLAAGPPTAGAASRRRPRLGPARRRRPARRGLHDPVLRHVPGERPALAGG